MHPCSSKRNCRICFITFPPKCLIERHCQIQKLVDRNYILFNPVLCFGLKRVDWYHIAYLLLFLLSLFAEFSRQDSESYEALKHVVEPVALPKVIKICYCLLLFCLTPNMFSEPLVARLKAWKPKKN